MAIQNAHTVSNLFSPMIILSTGVPVLPVVFCLNIFPSYFAMNRFLFFSFLVSFGGGGYLSALRYPRRLYVYGKHIEKSVGLPI